MNEETPQWLIYCHTNLSNNKKYIGLTKYINYPNKRWKNGAGYNKAHHKLFAAAIQKYGGFAAWDTNWVHEILESNIDSLSVANEREKYWIAYYHTYIGDPLCWGYNLTIGGDGSTGRIVSEEEKEYRRKLRLGTHLSEETRKKMSIARKGKPQHMTDKKIQQLKNMHSAWRGQHQSEEAVEKIRQASLGRLHTDETKNKISNTKKMNPNHSKRVGSGIKKPIECLETGIIYESITAASLALNISKSSIMSCAKGNRHTAGGYHWKYCIINTEDIKNKEKVGETD